MQIRGSSGRIGQRKSISYSRLAVRRPNRPYGQAAPAEMLQWRVHHHKTSVKRVSRKDAAVFCLSQMS